MPRRLPSPLDEIALFGVDPADPHPPGSAEEAAIAEARGKARDHFLAGRAAARAALAALSAPDAPLPSGPRGEVLWPDGLRGSVSHTAGLAVAALSRDPRVLGLGVDVERADRALRAANPRLVSTERERGWLAAPPAMPAQPLMLLVSAKEVVFKAYFELTGVCLGFHEAELVPEEDRMRARLLRALPGAPPELEVRFVREGDHIISLGALWR